MDQLYSGRTPRTVEEWRGWPIADIEARLLGRTGKVDVQDFVWGGMGDIVVSDRLLRILQEEEITGIDTRGITLTNVEIGTLDLMEDPDYQPPKLHRLVAKGIIERGPRDIPRPHSDWPVVLDLETWSGSDFCVAWGAWMLFFVSQRFAECLARHAVRNYRTIRGHEFTYAGHRYMEFPYED